jgi:hypothetical protein
MNSAQATRVATGGARTGRRSPKENRTVAAGVPRRVPSTHAETRWRYSLLATGAVEACASVRSGRRGPSLLFEEGAGGTNAPRTFLRGFPRANLLQAFLENRD